jgi:hypothetical protein
VVAMPGPDVVTVIDWSTPFVREIKTIALEYSELNIEIMPNPFYENVKIKCNTAQAGNITANVYDRTGRRINTLCPFSAEQGQVNFQWNGFDEAGRQTPDGIYFVIVTDGFARETGKVVLAR